MTSTDREQQPSLSLTQSQRRKLRKGTRSCWECKRRKMRCIYPPLEATTCNGCRRRGSQCISQEFPEGVAVAVSKPLSIDQDQARGHDAKADAISEGLPVQTMTLGQDTDTAATRVKLTDYEQQMANVLYNSLPQRQDIDRICAAKRFAVLAHETMTTPFMVLEQRGLATPAILLDIPQADQHPVLIARYMLLLATVLQSQDIKDLSEPDRAIIERMMDLATTQVTRNDRFLGSIEILECLMIESAYHANVGNLRRSWLAGRKAMSVAQLMGLNREHGQAQYEMLGSQTLYDSKILWFRIVDHDRYLCLMLGLPQGCLDRSMASDAVLASDSLLGRVERVHCVIASHILERNESRQSAQDPTLTRTLDVELQKAARQLPNKWWLVPNLRLSPHPQAVFWDTRRLFAQVLHYHLLVQLHLPYMLRSSSSANMKHEYSLITCVNASREILSRFIALRSFEGVAYSCRTIDFIALMAAMTLLLAHLDSHHTETENLLAHQYHSDRATIEQVQDSMEELNRVSSDALSAQIAAWLARLLAIDTETVVDGQPRCARMVSVQEAGAEASLLSGEGDGDNSAVIVQLPCFGTLKITRNGMSRGMHVQHKAQIGHRNATDSLEDLTPLDPLDSLDSAYSGVGAPSTSESDGYSGLLEGLSPSVPASHDVSRLQQGLAQYPDVAAPGENWAFQGVDWAFFENLTKHAGLDALGPEDAEWNIT